MTLSEPPPSTPGQETTTDDRKRLSAEAAQPHLTPIAKMNTQYQRVVIFENIHFGRVLSVDGLFQSSDLDEHVYHEVMVHPVMALHPRPRSVLILGGGEGATAREVLRHPTVENVTMVDIDGELIDFVREHWPWVAQGAFDDPRLDCVISDSREYLASTGDTFDVIIADMTAPTSGGPAERAYTIEAFELARARLAPGGLIVIQGDSAELGGRIRTLVSLIRTVRDVFGHAATCYASVPLLGGRYGFVLGCERPITLDPPSIASTLHERGVMNLRCVDEETLRGSFSVPRHIRDRLAQTDSIRASTDAKPSLTSDELYGATPAG